MVLKSQTKWKSVEWRALTTPRPICVWYFTRLSQLYLHLYYTTSISRDLSTIFNRVNLDSIGVGVNPNSSHKTDSTQLWIFLQELVRILHSFLWLYLVQPRSPLELINCYVDIYECSFSYVIVSFILLICLIPLRLFSMKFRHTLSLIQNFVIKSIFLGTYYKQFFSTSLRDQ